MSDIARLGFEIDSTQARSAATDLAKLNAAAVAASGGADKLNKTLRDTQGRFKSSYDVAKQYGSEVRSLADKYNPVLSAVYKYQAAQEELNRAVALGVVTQGQADATLERLAAQYSATANASQTMATGMVRSGGAVNRFGKSMAASSQHTTNLMFQFQDIGMMLAAGQNPLMLAMQQGTQVSGVFEQMRQSGQSAFSGIKGGLLAMLSPMSLLTIGAIAGGAALVQWGMSAIGAGEDARTLDDAMSELDAASSGLKSTQDILSMSVDELKEKYGSYGLIIKQVAADLAQNQLAEMNNALTQSIIESAGAFDQFAGRAATAFSSGVTFSIAVGNISRELGVTNAEAYKLAQGFDDLRNAMTVEDRIAAFRRVQDALRAAGVDASKLPPELNKAMTEAGRLAIKMAEAKGQAEALADAAPGAGWMGAAIGETNMLIGRLITAKAAADALGAAQRQFDRDNQVYSGRGGDPRQFMPGAATAFNPDQGVIDAADAMLNPNFGGGGSGGGGGTDPYADNLTRLIESLQTERETVDAWYNENLSILNDRRAMEIIGEQGHKDALLDLEREYQEKLASQRSQRLSETASFFGELANIATVGGQKSAKAVATFQAIEGTVNAYGAAIKALNTPGISVAGRFAAYASVLGAGLKGVSAIKAAGGGGGGSASATTSATSASRAEPERVTRVELQGEDWLVSLAETMMTQIYDASKNGRVIVARA